CGCKRTRISRAADISGEGSRRCVGCDYAACGSEQRAAGGGGEGIARGGARAVKCARSFIHPRLASRTLRLAQAGSGAPSSAFLLGMMTNLKERTARRVTTHWE